MKLYNELCMNALLVVLEEDQIMNAWSYEDEKLTMKWMKFELIYGELCDDVLFSVHTM